MLIPMRSMPFLGTAGSSAAGFGWFRSIFQGGKVVEVSTFRSRSEYEEVEAEDGTITQTDSLGIPHEDAFRRDLTINGLFYNIADFSIIDYVGGIERSRTEASSGRSGDSHERFKQDPVRMIRAIRHAANRLHHRRTDRSGPFSSKEEIRKCSRPVFATSF